ncbi:MAG: DUF1028 domain-containing protein [Pseudomonadota bacterium]
MIQLATFSIAARCPRSGMLGVAVSTAVPAIGGLCPFVAARIGAVATQSWVNPYLGIDGLALMKSGMSAKAALDKLLAEDPGREVRQVGIVDAAGNAAAFTGKECTQWCGHEVGEGFAVQGNMLVSGETVAQMAKAARDSAALSLPERLMRVLEAGQAAGGDKRGKQSAYIKVHDAEDYPYLQLGVDDHPAPVQELRRVYEVARAQCLPFVTGLSTRRSSVGHLSAETTAMLMTPPQNRPQRVAGE